MMSSIVKSPEHQQGPTSLAPSSSGRRKDAATPEGERIRVVYCGAAFSSDTHIMRMSGFRPLAAHTHLKPSPYEALTILFLSHTFQREGGSLLKVSLSKLGVSAVWSLISLLVLPHLHP